ncbi:MAG: TIGR03617 family F420-dependent LLM class oxidoreductase [Alphaproteobacteria bacterium]
MRIICQLPTNDWGRAARRAKNAEDIGYDGVTTSELAHDLFMPLAIASQSTNRVKLGTSIAVAFPRSPMIMANIGWDLNAQSGGRFELGLGSQVKGHNVRRFSTPWEAPVSRLREYVEAVRAIWRCWENGEKLNFEGKHYQFSLMTPEFSPPKANLPLPPISIAAVGPDMLRMAGRIADGVRLHGFCTRKYIENVCMPRIEEGMARSGRSRAACEISGGGFIATGKDEEAVQEKLDWVRYRIGFYGSTRTYLPVFEQHGLEELGLKLHRMSVEGKWKDLASQVSDDVVRLFAAVGDYDALPAAVADRFGGVVDTLRLDLPDDIDPDQHQDLITKLATIPNRLEAFQTAV